jgi:hypothetical protein
VEKPEKPKRAQKKVAQEKQKLPKDRSGKRIDGWPIIDEFDGTFDWKPISNTFTVPEDTRRVDVFAGLMECAGTVWFDDLKMEGFDQPAARELSLMAFNDDSRPRKGLCHTWKRIRQEQLRSTSLASEMLETFECPP